MTGSGKSFQSPTVFSEVHRRIDRTPPWTPYPLHEAPSRARGKRDPHVLFAWSPMRGPPTRPDVRPRVTTRAGGNHSRLSSKRSWTSINGFAEAVSLVSAMA